MAKNAYFFFDANHTAFNQVLCTPIIIDKNHIFSFRTIVKKIDFPPITHHLVPTRCVGTSPRRASVIFSV